MTTTNPFSAASGLQCPNLYDNESLLRFIDGKLCIVKGSMTLACVCLKNFYMPVSVWNESLASILPGETKRVELGMVADYGKRRYTIAYELLSILDSSPYPTITFELDVSSTERSVDETISFDSGISFTETVANLKEAINDNDNLKNEIEVINSDTDLMSFQIRAVNKGYEYGFALVNTGSPSIEIQETVIQSAIRYPYGRGKLIFVQPMYVEDVQPPLDSNNKHIEYAYDDDYQTNGTNATFRKLGKLYMHTSDDDVTESDMNLIETIWIKNTHTETLQVQVLVAS